MSSTTCTSLPQLEKVHTIAGTTQRSRAQVHPPTTPCVVDALLQYSTKVLSSKQYSTHQLCASQRAAENGDGDRDCRGWSTELCQTMLLLMVAGGGVRARTMLAEASVGGLVDRHSFWRWERRAEFIPRCDGGGAIGRRCCVVNGSVV